MKLKVGSRYLVRDTHGHLSEIGVLEAIPEAGLIKIQWGVYNGGLVEWKALKSVNWAIEREFPKVEAICENCRFWRKGLPDSSFGDCCKAPPYSEGGWAQPHATHWCGEFEAKAPEAVEVEV